MPGHGPVPGATRPSIRRRLAHHIERAAAVIAGQPTIASLALRDGGLVPPKHAQHGDFSTPLALALAKAVRRPPRDVAADIIGVLGDADGLLAHCEVAGPGHINCTLQADAWRDAAWQAAHHGAATLHSDVGGGEKILVEFVSANPTGPLHVAHGRGAVHGDVIARLLAVAGYDVTREYYVNDLGNQTDVLARSVWAHLEALRGKPFVAPAEFYPGDYVQGLAEHFFAHDPQLGLTADGSRADDWLDQIRTQSTAGMLARIRQDLAQLNVGFDSWVSERELTAALDMPAIIERLKRADHVFEQDGKLWFRTTAFGDDKDRVLVREDGRPTYFFGDVGYHDDKMRRGYARLVNLWGADHAGYVARVRAGLAALGHDPLALEIEFIQMVSLTRGGQSVKMGKRLGTAVWLKDVIDEAGRDATRYLFLMRRLDTQMEFDVELAQRKSLDNPVYYAQMGHARLRAIERKAEAEGVALPPPDAWQLADLEPLVLPEEVGLMRAMARAADVVADAARAREPHAVVAFVQDLIAQFHSYYSRYKRDERVISDDAGKTRARLLLCRGLANVLEGLLTLLGVDAPARMDLLDPDAT